MAAPSGTIWGSIVKGSSNPDGRQGKIGIYINVTNTNTQTTVNIQGWFATKYGVQDGSNSIYYDVGTGISAATTSRGSLSINHTVSTGAGWSTSNQTKLFDVTNTYNRGTSAVTYKVYVKFNNIDILPGSMLANTSFTVPALASYTISYNANGGTGAPSSQTKWYGKNITLSSTKPTRTGYSFQGWATSESGSVAYAAGASYTANAGATLYAVWKANTYTVSYKANGGTGAPANQTKTYGTTLKLSSTKPTRTNYNFLGWATSASATTATYAAGANYTANAAVTLYAVWSLAYVKPIIYNLTATRCNSSGAEQDDGTYALVKFDWETTNSVTAITIAWESASAGSSSATVTASGTSGSVSQKVGGSLSADSAYTITVSVKDSETSTAVTTLSSSMFPIDAKAGGDGVSFGKSAELGAAESLGGVGVADFGFDAKFNEPVYGNVLGLNRLPAIPANAELNDYMETGCWAIHSNAIAATITCGGKKLGTDSTVPPARAGRFEVSSSTGEGIRLEQWSYLRQRIIPYNDTNATMERDISRGDDNVWRYYDWWKSSLTPAASEKVYSKAAMTISLSASTDSSVTGAYTKVPLNNNVLSTSGRLTLENNSIRIGSNIQYVKVSGQMLLKCGNTSNNRHARIQKVSGGTTTSVAWSCVYGTASSNTVYPCTPIILSVKEGDLIHMVYYTTDASDYIASGYAANGWQTYLTVEEL